MLAIFTHFTRYASKIGQALRGLTDGFLFNLFYDDVDSMERGGSPNPIILASTQAFLLNRATISIAEILRQIKLTRLGSLLPFVLFPLPLLVTFWPRANEDNGWLESGIEKLKKMAEDLNNSLNHTRYIQYILDPQKTLLKILVYGMKGTAFVLSKIPYIKNQYLIKAINFTSKNILSISLIMTIGAYSAMLTFGNVILPLFALSGLAIGWMDRKNWLPLPLRNIYKHSIIPLSFLVSVFLGSWLEMIMLGAYNALLFSRHCKGLLVFLLRVFPYTKHIAQRINELAKPQKTLTFSASPEKLTPDNFWASINKIKERSLEVLKSHVLNTEVLLPPHNLEEKFEELLPLFDKIDWKSAKNAALIEKLVDKDWHVRKEQLREDKHWAHEKGTPAHTEEVIAYLRNNLATFIARLNSNDIHTVTVGAEDLVKRYTKGLIFEMKASQKLIDLTNIMGELAIDTGEYCGIGLLRAVQKGYLNSLTGKREKLSPKHCIALALQAERERFFQSKYLQRRLYSPDNQTDTHAYGRAIAFYAPRLGLPAAFADFDAFYAFPDFIKDIISARSKIENKYWKGTSPHSLKKEIRNAFATPLLPLNVVQRWFEEFIDKHVSGTENEKQELKDSLAYTVEFHGDVPVYQLKEDILTLLLVDAGIIALKPKEELSENELTVAKAKCVEEKRLKLSTPTPAPLIFTPLPAQSVPVAAVQPRLNLTLTPY